MKPLPVASKLILGCGFLLILNHHAAGQTGPGNALQFDGTSEFVQAPAITGGASGITVEAWVKPVNLTSPCEQVIVQAGLTPTDPVNPLITSSNDFQLRFWGCGTLLVFSCRVGIGFGYMEMGVGINPNDFMDGKWHHIAGTYSADSTRAIYRDGQKIAEMHSGGNYPPSILGSHLAIGAISDGTSAGGFFAGGIDEVRIWTKARTADEICQTLNQRLAGNEPFLAGYWRFDEGTGVTTSDSSGHGLAGVLVGSPSWIASGALNAIPVVATGAASNITANAAVLTGSASVCSLATSAWFEYGTNSSYGWSTSPVAVGQGTRPASFVQVVSGLDPDTVYHFRAWAINFGGASPGPDQEFRTAGPPKLSTLPPFSVTPTAATLQASVDPDGLETTVWFEWGTNVSYGTATPFQFLSPFAKSTVFQPITGLVSGITYHYRAVGTNAAGIVVGQDQLFTPAFSNTFVGCWGASDGSVAWDDYDGNGQLDLLVTAGDSTNVHTCLFRNGRAISFL